MITQSPSATVVCVVSALRPASRTFRHLRPVSSHHVCSGRSSTPRQPRPRPLRAERRDAAAPQLEEARGRHDERERVQRHEQVVGAEGARARRTGADATVSSASSQV